MHVCSMLEAQNRVHTVDSGSVLCQSSNCLRFATPAEANRRPEARRDTMRTSQDRTSDAQGCIDERQPKDVLKRMAQECRNI